MSGKIVILIWIGLIILLFLFSRYYYPSHDYFKARMLEKRKKYKDACFSYAYEVLHGTNQRFIEESRRRIKLLWQQHGPFDYSYIQSRDERDKVWLEGLKDAVKAVIQETTTPVQNNEKD